MNNTVTANSALTQLNLFDLFNEEKEIDKSFSSAEINDAINKLMNARAKAEKREAKERKLKKEEERRQKELDEKAIRDAHVREVTSMDLPMDWSNVFDTDKRTQGVHCDSIPDALVKCLTTLGKVDIEYISSVTGADYKTVICALRGSIYQDPDEWDECFYKGWKTSEEYLSGNLMRKRKTAKDANEKYDGYFSENVSAIEKVLPPTVATEDIYITLGSPWVPADVIDDFIVHLFGDPFPNIRDVAWKRRLTEQLKTVHDPETGTWEIPEKTRYSHSVRVKKTYGTERLEALYIIERTLNMRSVAVTDEVSCPANASGKKRVINQAETVAASEMQKKLINEFRKWVWTDDSRRARLFKIFEDNFACFRRRRFDGSFLEFPGMSRDVTLYPYQKDAVARILFTPNTLLAHDVGAGKTYVMIAAGQELRRMGLSVKNLYVVPNNIVGQWRALFKKMYPDSKVLCVTPGSFTPDKRKAVLDLIKNSDHDGIIMAYSCFEQIPLSKAYYAEALYEKEKKLKSLAMQKDKATSNVKKKLEKVKEAISELYNKLDDIYDAPYFDELGITRLFVDEAHNFKNVPTETKTNGVLGINGAGSQKCRDMLDKVHLVQRDNGGKGVVMATGTPITNSITDVFVMQQYLQSGELSMLDIQNFDSWIGMFAEKETKFEVDVDTSKYRLATRFVKFHNLTELTSLLSSVADFHAAGGDASLPSFDGRRDALIAKTPGFASYLSLISSRADDVRRGRVARTEDNMLKITTDGRKAALDLRLVDPCAVFTDQSKVARCAENAAQIYFDTANDKSTQLIFCDTSTPKDGFNLYDELRERLVLLGVPENETAFIHDAVSERRRQQLFASVRRGDIRILIGSTFKLGLGVNVQDKLIALHHLDVPWRPADMTQREGRILRQGNENKKVFIYRYVTEGSFDAYSWQLLETKQRFITGLLSGSLSERDGSDIDDTVLDYAEVKALAVGDPLIKQRIEASNEMSRYITLQKKLTDARQSLEKELLNLPARIRTQLGYIENSRRDADFAEKEKSVSPLPSDNAAKTEKSEQRRLLREFIGSAVRANVLSTKESVLTSYRGFEIILPANMTVEKPFVWLKRCGKYYVELGEADKGILIRIDNFIDSLDEYTQKLKSELFALTGRESDIKAELSKEEDYYSQIEFYKKRVEELDEKLGVNNQ